MLIGLLGGGTAQAGFIDLTTFTPGGGGVGVFAGTLNGFGVSGSVVSSSPGFFVFSATGTNFESSTINNTSAQYSHGSVFTPTNPLGDRVGYTMFDGVTGTGRFQITFAQPVTNPVFHVANLDSMLYDFTPTSGLTGLTLLRGNGGGGDGIRVDSANRIIADLDPTTIIGQTPTELPFTGGARSAYGSVALLGTFSSLTVDVRRNPGGLGDGGSFTISADPTPGPEPVSLTLLALGLAGTACAARSRRRTQRG